MNDVSDDCDVKDSLSNAREFLFYVREIMADEAKKDMSIVEDNVLEVYEVEDGALQECMMFVKKLSEIGRASCRERV